MIVRHYDPERDRPENLATLNPFKPAEQAWLAGEYAKNLFAPQNVILAEEDSELVGILHIFDTGLPWVILDGWYFKPEHRTLPNVLEMGRFVEEDLQKRGVKVYLMYAPERLAKGLQHHGLTTSPAAFSLVSRRFED